MPFVTVEGEGVYYAQAGAGRSPALVAIHGSGGDHTGWPEGMLHLKTHACYAVDLPGHGRSGGGGYSSVADYAAFVHGFVSTLKLDRVTLMGHSLGGAITQYLGLQQPPWLHGLVLVGTGARLRVLPAILDGLHTDFEATVALICEWAFGPDAPAQLVEDARQVYLATPAEVIHGDFSACDRFDIMGELGRIKLPTLVVAGTADRLTPVKYGRYLQQNIAGARLALIENGGHMMALEKPEAFVSAVAAFADETAAAP